MLALCFLIYGMIGVGLLSLSVPPFQNADEVAHMWRVDQISRGGLIGRRLTPDTSGGQVNAALLPAFLPFKPLIFHPERKVTSAMYRASASVRWDSNTIEQPFPNTAVYPPAFYLPAVIATWIAKGVHSSVLHTVYLARLANGVVAVVLAATGILAAGTIAPWLFAVAALPMALSLMADISQDSVMIGCAALLAGLVAGARQRPGEAASPALAWLCCGLAALIAAARPPYVPLALLPALLPGLRRLQRVLLMGAVVVVTLAWDTLAAVVTLTRTRTDIPIDPAGQVRWVLAHPGNMVTIAWRTMHLETWGLIQQFIGRLGWLDTPLPPGYLWLAGWLLIVALLLAASGPRVLPPRRAWGLLGLVVLAMAISTVLLFAVQYLTWDVVGAPIIDGVEGRYFIPLALALGVALPGLLPLSYRLRTGLLVVVAATPALGIVMTMHAVIIRYYLGS